MEEAASRRGVQRGPPCAPLEDVMTAQDGFRTRRVKIQGPDQTYRGTLQSRSTAEESSWRKHGEAAERCTPEGKDGKGAVGTGELCTLSQRLLKEWWDRRQSVSEPPITRRKRESVSIASLISVTREFH